MKILIISQYFWPENFRINELSEELCKLGHQITVLTGYPNYPNGYVYPEFSKNKKKYGLFKGARIVRIPVIGRKKNRFYLFLNYISF